MFNKPKEITTDSENHYLKNNKSDRNPAHPSFCSGFGIFHTNSPTATFRKVYALVTWTEIEKLVTDPQQCDKKLSQWVIFSNLADQDGRNSSKLYEKATFYALWLDIDQTGFDIDYIANKLREHHFKAFIYTSKSATKLKPKYRVILPLSAPVNGETFVILQNIMNRLFLSWKIVTDSANEKINQLCFLPNAGDYYDFRIIDNTAIHPRDYEEEINKYKLENATNQKELLSTRPENSILAQKVKSNIPLSNTSSPRNTIQAYNEIYSIESRFKKYGYRKSGNRWISPHSKSNEAGVTITPEKNTWTSHHQSDLDAGIGKQGPNHCFGDAFELFCYFEHQNNLRSALIAAGDSIMESGKSLNQINQTIYRRSH